MKIKQFQTKALDRAEKYAIVVLFFVFAVRMLRGYLASGSPIILIYLFDQAVVMIFMLLRRPAEEITLQLQDWLAGFGGTFLPLLVSLPTAEAALVPIKVAATLSLTGIFIHLFAKLSLRRSIGAVAANRGIKASGAYKYVRHPMYLGYMLVHLGVLLAGPNALNIAVISSTWILFFIRIDAEEKLLSTDSRYQALMRSTRFRLIPGIY